MELENVVRIKQWGYGEGATKVPLHIASIPTLTLTTKGEIFRRTSNRREGYQRQIAPTRLGRGKEGVTGYILDQMGIFPTSILVNIRKEEGQVNFEFKEKVNEFIEIGNIYIPDELRWYVIDGQHRLEGLKAAMREEGELKNYPTITSLTNESLFYEMLIFYLVNNRAKSVDTALAYRILQRMLFDVKAPPWVEKIMAGVDRRKAISAEVVDLLQEQEESPFKGKICQYGEIKSSEHVVKDDTLIRYIYVVLKEKVFHDMYEKDIAELLIRYWSAIKEMYPNTFTRSPNYALLDTFGLSVMHSLFPLIYGYCAKEGDVSKERMGKYLGYLLKNTPNHKDPDFKRPISEDWWDKAEGPSIIKGTGEGHYKKISSKLAEKMRLVIGEERSPSSIAD